MTTLYDIDLLQSRIQHLESEREDLILVAKELNDALVKTAEERDELKQRDDAWGEICAKTLNERDAAKKSFAAWKADAKFWKKEHNQLMRYNAGLAQESFDARNSRDDWERACIKRLNERDELRRKLEKSEQRNRQYSDALHNISHYIQKHYLHQG